MELHAGDVTLRDLTAQDIDDCLRWQTSETAWMDWDAPWEKDDPFDLDEYQARLEAIIRQNAGDESRTRHSLELDYRGRHIGFVNAYCVDENYCYAKEGRLCIGIDICEPEHWGKGIGGQAYRAYIRYLFSRGYTELFTQTWSGNERMLRMAERVGFCLCHTEPGIRQVRGETCDGVTLRLIKGG